jgi:hypothetical protein
MQRPQVKHPDAKLTPTGLCVYCRKNRADTLDHVIPRAVVKAHNRLAPDNAPSIPAKWLGVEFACHECNTRKSQSRWVPLSWRGEVAAMNRFFGGTPWVCWDGGPFPNRTRAGDGAEMTNIPVRVSVVEVPQQFAEEGGGMT